MVSICTVCTWLDGGYVGRWVVDASVNDRAMENVPVAGKCAHLFQSSKSEMCCF